MIVTTLPLSAVVTHFVTGLLTPSEAVAWHRERIARLDPSLRSVVTLNPRAEEEARAADARWARGKARSELDGVPFLAKDNLFTKGLRTTWGSALYEDFVPDHDELVVARLRDAGAVLLGKTNTPEFAAYGHTRNRLFGVTRNPWNPELTAGGSSGGSAAAVAAGFAAFALGTDAGGSVRRPAAHNGVVGFKPSPGRVPRGGGFPVWLGDLDVVGPITRSVADLDVVLRVIAQPEPGSTDLAPWTCGIIGDGAPKTIHVARAVNDLPVDPRLQDAVSGVARLLSGLGHHVRVGELRIDLAELSELGGLLSRPVVAELVAEFPDFADRVDDYSLRRLVAAQEGAAVDEPDIARRYARYRDEIERTFGDADVILTPTTAAQAWDAEQDYPDVIAGRAAGPRDHAAFTGWVNAALLPAISIPAGVDDDGLPIGVQLVARRGADEMLVALAAEVERTKDDNAEPLPRSGTGR
ncbi:amidase [Saccharomonospora sp. NPDC046836]|uniref:amidase n=1 Tax=Saccharomonospora sp. NPDC046836 TaxID=3156921 RepID=UPI0033C401FB